MCLAHQCRRFATPVARAASRGLSMSATHLPDPVDLALAKKAARSKVMGRLRGLSDSEMQRQGTLGAGGHIG